MSWTQEESEKLIELVSEHPCIFDKTHSRHFNHILKDTYWYGITHILKRKPEECKRQWRNLYGKFTKFNKRCKETGEMDRKSYPRLYQKMMFLDEVNDFEKNNQSQTPCISHCTIPAHEKTEKNPIFVGIEHNLFNESIHRVQDSNGFLSVSELLERPKIDEDLEEIRFKELPRDFKDPLSISKSSDDHSFGLDEIPILAKRRRLREAQNLNEGQSGTFEIKEISTTQYSDNSVREVGCRTYNPNNKKNTNQEKSSRQENTSYEDKTATLTSRLSKNIRLVLERLPRFQQIQIKENILELLREYEMKAAELVNVRNKSSEDQDNLCFHHKTDPSYTNFSKNILTVLQRLSRFEQIQVKEELAQVTREYEMKAAERVNVPSIKINDVRVKD